MYCKNPLGLPLKICEYPIGDRDDLAFVIILPARNSLQLIESQLNAALFEQLLAEMRPVELNSTLPVFTIHHRLDLRRVLIELGLSEMCEFSSRGNGLYASDAFCESSIKVGSKRIEARQHDCFLMRRGDEEINNQAPIKDINVNKASANKECFCENPFLFLIRNKRNRLILFMGKLVVPIDK
jgi:serine protease inhibitor